jgi:D-3-phosphoglycerate dehydrogenase
VKCGVGVDNIDIEAARSRRIPVTNIPDYAEATVAEGAFALMIALMKKTAKIDRTMRERGWIWPTPEWRGSDLAGKTLGLIGVGRIGGSMARIAGAGFQMRLLGYSPSMTKQAMTAMGMEKCENLHAMLAECDVVSIHTVLRQETFHLLGEDEFAAMKPTCLLVNTARGAIVDESALLRALREKRIGGAALDVYSREPLNREDHPLRALYGMDNVILSPHLTFYTDEAMARLEQEALARCLEIVEGKPVLVRSHDVRLRAQEHGVKFSD